MCPWPTFVEHYRCCHDHCDYFQFITIRFLLGKLNASSKWTRPQTRFPCIWMRWDGVTFLLCKGFFSVWCLIAGKVPISLCMCKISCATSITSVISYAMVNCSEWLVGISFATFRWWYPFIFSGSPGQEHGPVVREVSVSVSGPLDAPGIETKEDSCRCLNGPAHMKWLTDTHTAVCWH